MTSLSREPRDPRMQSLKGNNCEMAEPSQPARSGVASGCSVTWKTAPIECCKYRNETRNMWDEVSLKTKEFSFGVSDCGQLHIQAEVVDPQTVIYHIIHHIHFPPKIFTLGVDVFMQNMYILIEIV